MRHITHKQLRSASLCALLGMLCLATIRPLQAQIAAVPQQMNFQGRLARPDGTPVANGFYNLQFSLFTQATGGTLWWQKNVTNIPVRSGVFSARLDFTSGYENGATLASLFSAPALYIEVRINGGDQLMPRQQFVTVAYAMKADSVRDGAITSASLANGAVTVDKLASGTFNTLAWLLGGNSITDSNTQFLGTTNNQPLTLRVNDQRVLQMQYVANGSDLGMNLLGGYWLNSITAGVTQATVFGGGKVGSIERPNKVTDHGGTVSGGVGNQAGNDNASLTDAFFATVGGGAINIASNTYSTVAGGAGNTASGPVATVGGGANNTASGQYATVGGGLRNTASGEDATVGGGAYNTASAGGATVGGGIQNTASYPYSTVAGGAFNTASGNSATVAGGIENTAAGAASFAAGVRAKAIHQGAFVWGDNTVADFTSTAVNQFSVRSSGGIRLYTKSDLTRGVTLNANDSGWNNLSDRNAKTNFQMVDTLDLLEKLAAIPITTWNYKGVENPTRHIGPMAQDFFAAFGSLGMDDKHINTIDADGVAFAAIQGLNRKLEASNAATKKENAELKKRQAAIEAENAELRTELETLKAAVRQLQNNAK